MLPGPPSKLARDRFMAVFGALFEHSPWIAERAFEAGLGVAEDSIEGLHKKLCGIMRAAPLARKLALIRAHPDLAGKLARAGALTASSSREQAGAGLDQCSDAEFARFQAANAAYRARFGFPFIMAVRGARRADILAQLERRLASNPQAEFDIALDQIERIALFRLRQLEDPDHAN